MIVAKGSARKAVSTEGARPTMVTAVSQQHRQVVLRRQRVRMVGPECFHLRPAGGASSELQASWKSVYQQNTDRQLQAGG